MFFNLKFFWYLRYINARTYVCMHVSVIIKSWGWIGNSSIVGIFSKKCRYNNKKSGIFLFFYYFERSLVCVIARFRLKLLIVHMMEQHISNQYIRKESKINVFYFSESCIKKRGSSTCCYCFSMIPLCVWVPRTEDDLKTNFYGTKCSLVTVEIKPFNIKCIKKKECEYFWHTQILQNGRIFHIATIPKNVR